MVTNQILIRLFVSQIVLNRKSLMLIRTLISYHPFHRRKTVELPLIFSRRDIAAKDKVVICRTVLTIMINCFTYKIIIKHWVSNVY